MQATSCEARDDCNFNKRRVCAYTEIHIVFNTCIHRQKILEAKGKEKRGATRYYTEGDSTLEVETPIPPGDTPIQTQLQETPPPQTR